MKATWNAPGSKRFKVQHDELLSNSAFNCNLRRYIKGGMCDVIRAATKLATVDALISGFRSALTVQFIGAHGLIVEGRVVLDVKDNGDMWRVTLRDVASSSVDVKAPQGEFTKVENPFCNQKVKLHMMFYFDHHLCWVNIFVGGRDKKCNATSVGRCSLSVSKPVLKTPMI